MTQMIHKPTRISTSSQTLIDLIFANKPDRIIKTYNLITGLSDHNLILATRKLTKVRYGNQNQTCLLSPKRTCSSLKLK